MSTADGVPRERFTAMTRLDHNRAIAQLAQQGRRRGVGHHQHGGVGQPLADDVPRPVQREGRRAARRRVVSDEAWYADEYIPTVGKRGAAIIEARGASSAASAANAAIDHVHDWVLGTPEGDWVSMAVPSEGSYGVAEGIISSFPCTCSGGEYEIVQGLGVNDFSQERIDKTVNELLEERAAVQALTGVNELKSDLSPSAA